MSYDVTEDAVALWLMGRSTQLPMGKIKRKLRRKQPS